MKHLITTFILTVLFLVSISTLSSAQNTWDDHFAGMASVIFKDDTLHMWYNGNTPEPVGSIGYASSVGINMPIILSWLTNLTMDGMSKRFMNLR